MNGRGAESSEGSSGKGTGCSEEEPGDVGSGAGVAVGGGNAGVGKAIPGVRVSGVSGTEVPDGCVDTEIPLDVDRKEMLELDQSIDGL